METNEVKNKEELKVDENLNKSKRNQKVKSIILMILFNIITPYILYLITNINNEYFFLIRELRRRAFYINFSLQYEIMLIYGFYFFFKAIFKKSIRANVAMSILFNIISIISYYKVATVQKPFLPEDLLMIGNVLEIAQYADLSFTPILFVQLFLTISVLVIQFLITKYTNYEKAPKKITRIIVGIISTILILLCCLVNWSDRQFFGEDNLNAKTDYYYYGAVTDFFKKVHVVFEKEELDIYSEEKLAEVQKEAENLESKVENNQTQPNIIVIMGESFSDITQVQQLKFSEEPLQTFKGLSQEYTSGKTAVSIWGGETATSEFEFLTGSTMKFLPQKKYPYAQVVKSNTLSIVKTLKNEGYYTTAIHPNMGSFYGRKAAYEYLGFDKTVFAEGTANIKTLYNNYASDQDFADEVIRQYESIDNDKKFIFGITIESHSPYNHDKYEENSIKVTSDINLTNEEMSEIETYAQGIKNFDNALKYLIEYFKRKDEDVMLVVFGDHLPYFYNLYDRIYGESLGRYQTPYLIWTNYDEQIKVEENISLPGLSMRVLENANIELPWYYKYISNFYSEYPIFSKGFTMDKNGKMLDNNMRNTIIDNYNIIQYDILYKKNIK